MNLLTGNRFAVVLRLKIIIGHGWPIKFVRSALVLHYSLYIMDYLTILLD